MNQRDEFSKSTIITLAKRVGFLCSNPDCRCQTIGAHEQSDKSTSVGVAAHITAASTGGPRYDESLSHPQRRHADNGIWLCNKCSTLIDKDPKGFPVEKLKEWKQRAENESRKKLSGQFKAIDTSPILQADLTGWSRIRTNRGLSSLNPIEEFDGKLVMVPGHKPIIHWNVWWKYKLVIFNNSTKPAFNVQVENVGKLTLSRLQHLPDVNNIPPLENKIVEIEYDFQIESRHDVPDEMMERRFPPTFNDLRLELTYYDEAGNIYHSYVTIRDNKVITEKQ